MTVQTKTLDLTNVQFFLLAVQSVVFIALAMLTNLYPWVMKNGTAFFSAWLMIPLFDAIALYIAFEFGKNRKWLVTPMLLIWLSVPVAFAYAFRASISTYAASEYTRGFTEILFTESSFVTALLYLLFSIFVTYVASHAVRQYNLR